MKPTSPQLNTDNTATRKGTTVTEFDEEWTLAEAEAFDRNAQAIIAAMDKHGATTLGELADKLAAERAAKDEA